jgi:hypothetical protein
MIQPMTKREIKQLAKRISYTEKEIMEDEEYFLRKYPAHIEDAKRYLFYKDAIEVVVKWFKRLINIS